MNEWIDVKVQKPEWGQQVIVYRGKIDTPMSWKFDNLPPTVELTNKFDNAVTHWIPFPELPKMKEEDGKDRT